ncbi:MAG: hypothetical protein WAK01_07930 [Methylocystis sp.]
MTSPSKTALIGAACILFMASALPAGAVVLSGSAIDSQAASAPLLEDAAFGPPAGHRCLKWTRRMNTRHGFARRCVQWR